MVNRTVVVWISPNSIIIQATPEGEPGDADWVVDRGFSLSEWPDAINCLVELISSHNKNIESQAAPDGDVASTLNGEGYDGTI